MKNALGRRYVGVDSRRFLVILLIIAAAAGHGRPGPRPACAWHRHRRHGPVGPPAGRFLPLRERQVGRQHADPRRPVRLRHVRHPSRARPRRPCAASSKPKRARAGGAGLEQPEGRRLLQELHGRGAHRVARHHAAQGRAGGDRAHQRRASELPAAFARAAQHRRAAALLGERRRRTSATPSSTPCRSRSRGSACPTATTTCGTTRSSPRLARPTRPTSPGSSRSANQPDPEGAAARILALETTIAEAAVGPRAQPRSQRDLQQDDASTRCRRRRRTSTGRRTSRRCRPARRPRSRTSSSASRTT